jgi:hypothetical protein
MLLRCWEHHTLSGWCWEYDDLSARWEYHTLSAAPPAESTMLSARAESTIPSAPPAESMMLSAQGHARALTLRARARYTLSKRRWEYHTLSGWRWEHDAISKLWEYHVTKLEYFCTYLRYLPTNPTSRHCDSDLDIRSHFFLHNVIWTFHIIIYCEISIILLVFCLVTPRISHASRVHPVWILSKSLFS